MKLSKYLLLTISLLGLLTTAFAANAAKDCLKLLIDNNYKEALSPCTIQANLGDVHAQYSLGYMYSNGHAVLQNYKQAARWYIKAAEQGDVEAQYNLGIMYSKGQGVPQDYTQSANFYIKAAHQGYISAQYNLGRVYSLALKDNVEAFAWYNVAVRNGHKKARHNRDVIEKKMTYSQLNKAQKLSEVYYIVQKTH